MPPSGCTSSSFLYTLFFFLVSNNPDSKKKKVGFKKKVSGDGLCARPCVMHCAEGRSSAVFFPLSSTLPICLLNHSYLCSRGLDKNMKDVKRARFLFRPSFLSMDSVRTLWDDLSRMG